MNVQPILLVEDNEDDAFFMQQAVRDAEILNPVIHVEDGQQAIDYLSATGRFADRAQYPIPTVVFLDLKLPLKSGHQVLEWIRAQPQFQKLIVIVLTSSNEPVDLNRSYQLGANSFVVKPPTAQQLLELAEAFKLWWLRQNRVA
jgi:CheY-like chemotaxis protein